MGRAGGGGVVGGSVLRPTDCKPVFNRRLKEDLPPATVKVLMNVVEGGVEVGVGVEVEAWVECGWSGVEWSGVEWDWIGLG